MSTLKDVLGLKLGESYPVDNLFNGVVGSTIANSTVVTLTSMQNGNRVYSLYFFGIVIGSFTLSDNLTVEWVGG